MEMSTTGIVICSLVIGLTLHVLYKGALWVLRFLAGK